MKHLQMTFLLAFLLLFTTACDRFLGRDSGPKTEYIFELDAADWLTRKAARPVDANLLAAIREIQPGDSLELKHPLDGFAEVIRHKALSAKLELWFPKPVSEFPAPDAMASLRKAYDADVQLVMHSMQARLKGDPSVTVDAQQHVHAILDSAMSPKDVRKLLLAQGELGFYETFQRLEIENQIAAVRHMTLVIEGGDTTLDLYRLLRGGGDVWEAQATQQIMRPDYPVIGIVQLQDTASVNALLHSQIARETLPPTLRLAWSIEEVPDLPGTRQLIALRTQNDGSPDLDGECVVDARQDFSYYNRTPMISLTMNDRGAATWKRMTRNNLNRQIAIVFDDYVYSFPTVQSEIEGGKTQITGNFTLEETDRLARIMNSNVYPARVRAIKARPFPRK